MHSSSSWSPSSTPKLEVAHLCVRKYTSSVYGFATSSTTPNRDPHATEPSSIIEVWLPPSITHDSRLAVSPTPTKEVVYLDSPHQHRCSSTNSRSWSSTSSHSIHASSCGSSTPSPRLGSRLWPITPPGYVWSSYSTTPPNGAVCLHTIHCTTHRSSIAWRCTSNCYDPK